MTAATCEQFDPRSGWGGGGAVRERFGPGPVAVLALVSLLSFTAPPRPAAAQNGQDRVRVFLDCQTRRCAEDEFRTEITFVDWVRERTVADLHVILTSQQAGGGTQYVFDFIGQNEFEDEDFRLEQTVSDTDTRDEVLEALVQAFKGGLVAYVARRGYLDQLEIRSLEEATEEVEEELAAPESDPWNLWVFTIGADFEADGEERQSSYEIGGDLNARRVTPDWKIFIRLGGDQEHQRVELSEGTFINDTDNWDFGAMFVRSLSSHWSAGTLLGANTSTSLNRKIGGDVAAAIEWNFYPYEQANRRQFILHYQVGVTRVEYEDTTIFGKIDETLYDQRLVAVYDTRQPWGNVSFSAEASNLLHDFSKYRLEAEARTNFRLFRGFDLEIQGGYEVIRDQVYLPAAGSTDEEILVQRRELATGYEYRIEVGFNYRFGSIYNNVVNNRFPWEVLF
ncbi:MAG: hypothetical protein R3314_09170 [Longimicrobiales bacterium]|nr:hypothetical protein [Longimicrobiales bacterium]